MLHKAWNLKPRQPCSCDCWRKPGKLHQHLVCVVQPVQFPPTQPRSNPAAHLFGRSPCGHAMPAGLSVQLTNWAQNCDLHEILIFKLFMLRALHRPLNPIKTRYCLSTWLQKNQLPQGSQNWKGGHIVFLKGGSGSDATHHPDIFRDAS